MAQKDSRTPFLAVMFAAALNLVGDWALITRFGLGIRGAAWATAASQIAGALALLWTLQTFSAVHPMLPLPPLPMQCCRVRCGRLGPTAAKGDKVEGVPASAVDRFSAALSGSVDSHPDA